MDLGGNTEPDSSLTDDEDCDQDGEMADRGRRRRFCNERAEQRKRHHQLSSTIANQPNKLPRLGDRRKAPVNRPRYQLMQGEIAPAPMACRRTYPMARPRPVRRPVVPYDMKPRLKPSGKRYTTRKVFNTTEDLGPHDSVIFVNPTFIKNFLKKATLMMHPPGQDSKEAITDMPIEDVKFTDSPADAIQAAATMAIIRLVTECIGDDSKRDEKCNKMLASRLMLKMEEFARREQSTIVQDHQDSEAHPKRLALT